jgi:hypothetical protein
MSDKAPTDEPNGKPIDRLIALIKAMKPFQDTFGGAHCMMAAGNSDQHIVCRLDDQAVFDLLTYRYFAEHKKAPPPRDISAALAIIKGELWHTRREPLIEDTCPVLRAMCKAAEIKESWGGAAGELLALLQTLVRDNLLLKEGEELPASPDAMGVWLSKNALKLSGRGIELYRPKATATKRLWAWRRVSSVCDTPDALKGQAPGVVSQDVGGQVHDTCGGGADDTLTEQQQLILDELHKGDH